MRYTPPIDRTIPYVELRREVLTDDIEITVPSGDSYDCTLDEAKLYLLQLGAPELRREKAIDWVWNLYAVRFHLDSEYQIEILKAPQYPEVAGPRPLEEFAWVIEPGRVK